MLNAGNAVNDTALAAAVTGVTVTGTPADGWRLMLCQGYGGPFTKGSPLTPAALPISRNDGWVAIAIELLPIPDKNSSVQFLAMF